MLSLAGGSLSRIRVGDEVHAAYPVRDLWCFVCELSIVLFQSDGLGEVARYIHDDVLLSHTWSGDHLVVTDFNGRELVFEPAARESPLVLR